MRLFIAFPSHFSVAVLVAPQLIGRGNYGIIAQGFTRSREKHGP